VGKPTREEEKKRLSPIRRGADNQKRASLEGFNKREEEKGDETDGKEA